MDLTSLLTAGMGPGIHWYPADVPLERLAATLVGMANTDGGIVLIGISPRSGHIQGVSDSSLAVDRVFQAAMLASPPLVLPLPQVLRDGSARVLEVLIPAGLPHLYSLGGRYLWREGFRNNPMPAEQLRRKLMERGLLQFEERLPQGASLDDLDPLQVEVYAHAYQSALRLEESELAADPLEILVQRGCLRQDDGALRPTYAALLLFGRNPQRWLPSATILAVRFPGTAFGDQYIKQDIRGSLPQQLQQAETFLRHNLQSVVRISGLVHQEMPEYPFEAVRELLVNAVAHRDYNQQGDTIHLNIFADRLEVTSPGGLPGPVNLQNLLEARFSRNAVLVQILSDQGFVERLGYGLDRVVRLMQQNDLRPPKFEESAGGFRVTLYNAAQGESGLQDLAKYRDLDLNPRQELAVGYLGSHRRLASSDFQALCPEVHPETLRRDLADLVARGVLIKVGDKKATYYILK